jgi:hypothetical protein
MPTTNEKLADHAVAHAIDQYYYSNGVVRRIIALLNRVDADLFRALTDALEQMDPESFSVQRLDELLTGVRRLNVQAYQAVERELTDELKQFVEYEAGYQYQLFKSTIPPQVLIQVDVASVGIEQVYAAALAQPFRGVLLREALSGLEAGRAKAIRDAIRIGYVENQTTSEIVKRIRGTKARQYSDGLMNAPRQHVEAIVRTAISHTAGFTRNRFYEANNDLIKAESWLSTIDGRTTPECRIRDQLQYTVVDHKPIGHKIPWLSGPGRLHYCCRSTSTPVTKSWKELGGVDIGEFSPATRASMSGEIPANMTWGEWIKRQSQERQDEYLGPTRAKLLRDGGLTFDQFYSEKGTYLTLSQLAEKNAEAFAKAGL